MHIALLRMALHRAEHTCPADASYSCSSQAMGHRDSGWPERVTYRKSQTHMSPMCCLWSEWIIFIAYMYHYLPNACRCRRSNHLIMLLNSTQSFAFMYFLREIGKKKNTTVICRGQNSLKMPYHSLSLSNIKKSICENWEGTMAPLGIWMTKH